MKTLRVALLQLDVAWGNPQANRAKVRRALDGLAPCDLAILPELWSGSYDNPRMEALAEESPACLEEVATWCRDTGSWALAGTLPWRTPEGLANRAFLLDEAGGVRGTYDKVHLFPLLAEPEHFIPGKAPLLASLRGVRFAAAVCYDIRFPEFLRRMALEGAEVIGVCAEWPLSRIDAWRTLLRARAMENQLFVVGVNRAGWGGEDLYGGHSLVAAPDGTVLYEAGEEEETGTTVLDLSLVPRTRKAIPAFRDRRPDLYGFLGENREREDTSVAPGEEETEIC